MLSFAVHGGLLYIVGRRPTCYVSLFLPIQTVILSRDVGYCCKGGLLCMVAKDIPAKA